jgi:Flp pilus assembly protein TadG
MRVPARIRSWLIGMSSSESGVAAVEFALAVPVMLILYLGSVEGSTLIIMDRKIQTAASALGDLVSRTDGALSQGMLEDYFQAASGIMHPYASARVVQTISGIEVFPDGTTTVKWSKQYSEGQYTPAGAHMVGSSISLPKEMTNLASGQIVIVAEASYDYAPSFAVVIDQAVQLHRTSYHMPRTSKGVSVSP